MHKLQSFFILKFESDKLKRYNYNVNITLDQARLNGEVVRLGDCELLRALRRFKEIEFDENILYNLEKRKRLLKHKISTSAEITNLDETDKKIDEILFVPEIVNVHFTDVRHYKQIMNKGGIKINGKWYRRLLCSAGMARRSIVMFFREGLLFEKIEGFLLCGWNKDTKINPNKFNAYVSLCSSATHTISIPNFTVVPDREITRKVVVDFLSENEDGADPSMNVKEIECGFNLFDGQGLVSPRQALLWSKELGLSYVPSAFVFRGAWSKGLLAVFDFHKFSTEYNSYDSHDVYGEPFNVLDVDVILSASQFKMIAGYENLTEYKKKTSEDKYGWGISRVSPAKDKDLTTTTYQYLQSLKMSTEEIESICKRSISWLQGVSGQDWEETVSFLLGESLTESPDIKWFNRLSDPILKCLLLDKELLEDSYIRQYLLRIVNKKIRESYMGVLQISGNYQFMISDPFAQACHILGIETNGLLEKNTYYSDYWNRRNVDKLACFRSPNTWRSECLSMSLSKTSVQKYWYQYINSGIIFNINDESMMKLSGADVDGDICMTTPELTEYIYDNYYTPAYERKIAEKKSIAKDDLWKSDLLSFGSNIGLVTNYGTTYYEMMSLYPENSIEYKIIENRIKICNCLQSCEIDKTKGIKTIQLPKYWSAFIKKTEDMPPLTQERIDIYNKIICKKRAYFMRYVYPTTYGKKYLSHVRNYENMAMSKHGKRLTEILNDEKILENNIKRYFYQYSPLLEGNGVMNRICKYMEERVKEIKISSKLGSKDAVCNRFAFVYDKFDKLENWQELVNKMSLLYRSFFAYKKMNRNDCGETDEIIKKTIRNSANEISSNIYEIIALALDISVSFAFTVFGEDMVYVLFEQTIGKIFIPGREIELNLCETEE